MAIDITIPEMGESVRTGVVARWLKNDGDAVTKDQVVMELETDKITAEITAPVAGRLRHSVKVGDTVPVGSAVGRIEEGAGSAAPAAVAEPKTPATAAAAPAAKAATPAAPLTGNGHGSTTETVRATPLAEKIAKESGVDLSKLQGTGPGGRIREQDVTGFIQARPPTTAAVSHAAPAAKPNAPMGKTTGGSRRERISPLRARIAERLVHAQHTAAMLTTFNEVDMTNVTALRKKFKDEFEKKHGIGLGFMSFFVKAAANALKQFPVVNAYLAQSAEGALEVEYHDYVNISVAVSTPKGLTVPVLRNVESMTFAQVELAIKDLAERARDGKLTLDDLQGGTFTVSNGGIFGSLMSTPILNAPQTAILGMHGIKNRPVEHPEKPGEIALRPMMYLAMSYDHRLLDGQESVRFLVAIKNAIENPDRLLLDL